MNIQRIILAVLSLSVVLGLGFLVVNKNKQVVKNDSTNNPTQVPKDDSRNYGTDWPPQPVPYVPVIEFGKSIKLNIYDKVQYRENSLSNLWVTLKQIDDSRCTGVNVECVWAGELSAVFILFGGKITEPKEVRLGTATEGSGKTSLSGYTFTLKDVTTSSAIIEVVKLK